MAVKPKRKDPGSGVVVLAGRGNPLLGKKVASALGTRMGCCRIEDFPDEELHVEVREKVQGEDVYILQPTDRPIGEKLLELLLLADACCRAGARRLTAVLPYCGYARQDRRTGQGEPVSARMVADLLSTRFHKVIAVDLHNPAIEGFFKIPLEHISAVPLLAEAARDGLSADTLVVAPDLGAVKLAQEYADLLNLPVVYVHKNRESATKVQVRRVVGEVKDRPLLLVDDMASTGGTLFSAAEALLGKKCRPQMTVAVTHSLMVGKAAERLRGLPLQKIFVTDSLPQKSHPFLPVEVVGIAPLLAGAIRNSGQGKPSPQGEKCLAGKEDT